MLEIFDSFQDFAIFYVIAVAIVILGIIFNDELRAMEDKFDEYVASKKLQLKHKIKQQSKSAKAANSLQRKNSSGKKKSHFAA